MAVIPEKFWVVDVEGNGGSPPEMVELAMVEVSDLALTGQTKRWLLRPSVAISSIATGIHGIRDKDVVHCPPFATIADEVENLLDGCAIVGHNVRVEVDVLTRALPRWQPTVAVDTLKLARNLRPRLESYSLTNLGDALSLLSEAKRLTGKSAHSALFDATLSALVFLELLSALPLDRRGSAILDADIFDEPQGSLL